MKYNHPVKTLRINCVEVKVEYVELRRVEFNDMIEVLAFYEQPNGVLEGQMMHSYLDDLPLLVAKRHYPDAQWYNKYLSQQPSVEHLSDGDDMEEYERECLHNEESW
jgi:hypothetical protein